MIQIRSAKKQITLVAGPDAAWGHASAWRGGLDKLLDKTDKPHHCSRRGGSQCGSPCLVLLWLCIRNDDTATHRLDLWTSVAEFWGPSLGISLSYSCLWNLDLWIIKAFLVGHCFWHRGQTNPDELTCFASTWFWTCEIFFELYPHSVHCQHPLSFLNMKLFTKMFRPSIVSA